MKSPETSQENNSEESRFKNKIELKLLKYERLASAYRKEKWDISEPGDELDIETTTALNGTFINEKIRDHVIVIPGHHRLVLQLDISNEYVKPSKDNKEFFISSYPFKYELQVATKYQVSFA